MKSTLLLPLSLYVVSLVILLTSHADYRSGDAVNEFATIQRIAERGWDIHVWGNNNSSIVTTVIAPWLSRTFNLEPPTIYTYIFIPIFAFTPVLLYFLYRRLLTSPQALFAALFFLTLPPTYQEVPTRGKSLIAEPLMALLLLVLLGDLKSRYKVPIVSVLLVLVIACHYTIGIILLCWLLVMLIVSKYKTEIIIPAAVGITFFLIFFYLVGDGTILSNLNFIHQDNPDIVQWSNLPGHNDRIASILMWFSSPSKLQSIIIYLSAAWIIYGGVKMLLRREFLRYPEISVCAVFSGVMIILAVYWPFITRGLYLSVWVQMGAVFLSILFGAGVTSNKFTMLLPSALLLLNFFVLR